MTLTSGNVTNGTWTHVIDLPSNSTMDLHYIINATDTSFNVNSTGIVTVPVLDDDRPLAVSRTLPPATTGEPLSFVVDVVDNIGVDTARVFYWFGDDDTHGVNVSLAPHEVEALGNGTYMRNITIPAYSNETLHFFFITADRAGNVLVTNEISISVEDNDLPSILEDLSSTEATTGDPFEFAVNVSDNIEVAIVRVMYWPANDRSSARELRMAAGSTDAAGNGTYAHSILLDAHSTVPLVYTLTVVDTSGNRATSPEARVDVLDDDAPEGLDDHTRVVPGELLTVAFNVSVTDNIGVLRVNVEYWFDDGAPVTVQLLADATSGHGNGTYVASLDVPWIARGLLSYRFTAIDDALNSNRSATFQLALGDDEAPVFRSFGHDGEGLKGASVVLWANVTDDIGLYQVHAVYWFPGGTPANVSLDDGPPFSLTVRIPRNAPGPMSYRFVAMDLGGNWNTTATVSLEVFNAAPEVNGTISWTVTEEEEARLDLDAYLGDANDPVTALIVECDDADVTVEGHQLVALFDEWVPDHDVLVTVSDGEDTTAFNVTVIIQEVNDPPAILDPPGTLEAVEDQPFRLDLEVADPDDTEHGWTDDSDLFDVDPDTGVLEFTPTQANVGTHHFTVTVDDGRGGTDSVTITLVVANVNDPPVITSVLPANGTSYREGRAIDLNATAEDEDGDDLTFTWMEGDEVLATGADVTVTGLRAGVHEITLVVTDGQERDEETFQVVVEERPEAGSGVGMWVVALIALVVLLLVAAVVVMRRSGSGPSHHDEGDE